MLPGRLIKKYIRISSFCILTGISTAILIPYGIQKAHAQSSPLPPATAPSSASSDLIQSTSTPQFSTTKSSIFSPTNQATSADLKASPNTLQVPSDPKQVEIQKIVKLTLDQAIKTAQGNSLTLRVTRLRLTRSQASLREVEASLYPTLAFQTSLSRDISASNDISVQVSRQSANRQIEQGQATLQNLLATPTPADPIAALLLQQQIQSTQSQLVTGEASLSTLQNYGTTSFNNTLTLNYNLYTGGQRPALIQSAKEQVQLAELEVERVSEQLRLDVTNVYYDVQSADEQVRIESAVEEATRSLRTAEVMAKSGLSTKLDVLNAQVQLDDAAQQLASAQTQQQSSQRQLSRLLNVPVTITVAASDSVTVSEQWKSSLEESIVQALKKRVELQQQLVQRRISINQREVAQSALRPRVGLYANYSVLEGV